ncbi:DUF5412 family protein [Rossellomorea vietnamensis]|uniref:DUF5412 family protein n=1 Tax=Rossellomorea vietnamensis TaxID=218284 RepID=UPI0020784B4B|nr:DUF5412 family protein [Rossellomorea vietnamensis]
MFYLLIACTTLFLFLVLSAKAISAFIKKKPFPKRLLIATLSGVVLVSSIYIYEAYFFTFDQINKESMQKGPGPVTSPTDAYTADAYYEPYGGAAGGVNVWVEVTYNNEDHKVQTVYYGDAKSTFNMDWLDEDTLQIQNLDPDYPDSDRSINLRIGKDIYHEFGLACQSILMKDEYETCYKN